MKKWASKERGLRMYAEGKDVHEKGWWAQDGSWAFFPGVRVYHRASNDEEVCLSLTVSEARKLIAGLQDFVKLKGKKKVKRSFVERNKPVDEYERTY